MRACEGQQFSDQMVCTRCVLVWDVNDPCPPRCELPGSSVSYPKPKPMVYTTWMDWKRYGRNGETSEEVNGKIETILAYAKAAGVPITSPVETREQKVSLIRTWNAVSVKLFNSRGVA